MLINMHTLDSYIIQLFSHKLKFPTLPSLKIYKVPLYTKVCRLPKFYITFLKLNKPKAVSGKICKSI